MNVPLLLTGQFREDLQRKYKSAPPSLKRKWDHVILLGRTHPFWYSSYTILAWLVTGAEIDRNNARHYFLEFIRHQPTALLTREVQFHTHACSAMLGRLAIFYDWCSETDLLTPDETGALHRSMLALAFAVPLDQLMGRARAFDNQILANAFGAAVTGYVLGVRRGNSPLARRLYQTGTAWLRDQFGRLSPACYSGEGSTYHMTVVEPLLLLSGIFLEEATGEPVYENGIPPTRLPLRNWLIMARDLIGPCGGAPGWDAYGHFHCRIKSPLVYLARRDDIRDPLDLVDTADMWCPMAHAAWEFDDRMWSLVWWPDEADTPRPYRFRSWINPATAGALQQTDTGTRLFQYWDATPGLPHCGRPNVNPNSIQFDYAGIPLLLDGSPHLPPESQVVSPAAVREYIGDALVHNLLSPSTSRPSEDDLNRAALRAVQGGLAESNSLVFDDEFWYAPKRESAGQGLSVREAGRLQAIESECAGYYRDRYDVRSVRRLSLLVDGRIALIRDRVLSDTPHRLTWQAFVWPGARIINRRVRVESGGMVRLDVLPPDLAQLDCSPIRGWPQTPCNGSTRIHASLPESTTDGTLRMTLVAQDMLTPLREISNGWQLEANGETFHEIDLTTFYLVDRFTTGTPLRFSKRIDIDYPAHHKFLRLRFGLQGLSLRVNGCEIPPVYEQTSQSPVEYRLFSFPWIFDLSTALQMGTNEIEFVVDSYYGESLKGPVEFCLPVQTIDPEITVTGPDECTIMSGNCSWTILLENRSMRPWCNGQTDARHALRNEVGIISFLHVSHASFDDPEFDVVANQPVDIAYDPEGLIEIGGMECENAHAVITLPVGIIRVSGQPEFSVGAWLTKPIRIRIRSEQPVQYANQSHASYCGVVEFTIDNTKHPSATPLSHLDAVYALLDAPTPDLKEKLQTCLQSSDWMLQTAAAEVTARLQVRSLANDLLALYRLERKRESERALTKSWAFSKMNFALAPDADHSLDTTADPYHDAKRWRLRRALIDSLGRLNCRNAIPDLIETLQAEADFFPALAQVPLALARLDAREALPVVEAAENALEINVQRHARLAGQYLRAEIDRSEFERLATPL